MIVGDLVVGRSRACIGIIVKEDIKRDYVWVYWSTGGLRNERSLESKDMLYLFNGGDNGTHLLDWG